MEIIGRSTWGARAPRNRNTTTWAHRTEFVVHYSDGPTSQTPRNIQNFHMDTRGWSDIAYNFLVDKTGKIYEGRGWLTVGAHATGHNTSGVGVCFIGLSGDATPAALASIRDLYDAACGHAGRTLLKRGHGQLSQNSTDCPGHQLLTWVKAGMSRPGTVPLEHVVPSGAPLLRLGDAGSAVRNLQDALNYALGLTLSEDGDFGEKTKAAVVLLQQGAKLDDDGIYGPASAQVLRTKVETKNG